MSHHRGLYNASDGATTCHTEERSRLSSRIRGTVSLRVSRRRKDPGTLAPSHQRSRNLCCLAKREERNQLGRPEAKTLLKVVYRTWGRVLRGGEKGGSWRSCDEEVGYLSELRARLQYAYASGHWRRTICRLRRFYSLQLRNRPLNDRPLNAVWAERHEGDVVREVPIEVGARLSLVLILRSRSLSTFLWSVHVVNVATSSLCLP